MARTGREKKGVGSKGRCYLIDGGDGLLVDWALARLRKSEAGGQAGACQTFWAPEKAAKPLAHWSPEELARIGSALSSPSFFSASTMVVIRGAERIRDDDLDQVVKVFERQAEATLVVVAAGNYMERRLRSRLKENPLTVIPAKSLASPEELFSELRNLARELGCEISSDACELLQELVGNNLLELKLQLAKVSVSLEGRKSITAEDVSLVVGHSRSHVVWEIVNAVGERKAKEALKLVAQLMDEGVELPLLVGALAGAFRRVWLAKDADPGEAGKPKSSYYDRQRARRFKRPELRHALKLLAGIDLKFKLGRGEPRWLLEQFVFEMCRLPLVA